MGDFAGLLTSLNLSPINTVLLAVFIFVLIRMDKRLQAVEKVTVANSTSIAFIKGQLTIKEEDDE